MKQALDAVYQDGVFRPLTPPAVADGQQVRWVVEADPEARGADVLDLAARVYDGLSDREIDEIERIALGRRVFFTESGREAQ